MASAAPSAPSSETGSFFESKIMEALGPHLSRDVAGIVADYVIQGDAFLAADWLRVFGVKTEQVELDDEFYRFWFSPDVGDRTKLNCETHIGPYLCPETASPVEATEEFATPPVHRHRFAPYVDFSYDLETLGCLVQNPREGHPSRFESVTEALRQNGKNKAGRARILVMRKEGFARGLSRDQQIAHMEELNRRPGVAYTVLPSALDLATVALVHQVVTGERYLGDETGMERRWTAGRSSDLVRYGQDTYPVIVGFQSPLVNEVVGGPGPSGGFCVYARNGFDIGFIVAAGLREFPGHR